MLIRTSDKKSYAVTDFHLKEILSFQPLPVSAAFYYGNTFYAITQHDSAYWVSWSNFEGGGKYQAHDYSYYLVTEDAQSVKALERYKLRWMTDSSGYRIGSRRHRTDGDDEFDGTFSGYFMTEDSAGNTGIVDINGDVLLPAVSFKYRKMTRIGTNVFLVDNPVRYIPVGHHMQDLLAENTMDATQKHKLLRGLPYLVNGSNAVLLDSLTVERLDITTQVATPLLYTVYLKRPPDNYSGDDIWFYMNDNGKAYYRKLPAW